MILVCATNENAGADNITTPAGWTLLTTFRQGTTVVNIAVFGKIAAGGETSVTVTSSAAQRFQTWFGEFNGYTLTLDGSPSSAGSTALVLAGDSGTTTPSGAGDLALEVVVVKNSPASGLTEIGGFTPATVTNEGVGVTSTQKLLMGVFYDLNRSTAAREQATWTTTTAGFAGVGLLLSPPPTPPPALARNASGWSSRSGGY